MLVSLERIKSDGRKNDVLSERIKIDGRKNYEPIYFIVLRKLWHWLPGT